VNVLVFELLASGVGLRQTARKVGLTHRCLELKARKVARHLRRINVNLTGRLPGGASLQFDEFETFEGRRNTRPLSVPVVIERDSRFVIWAEAAPIRPRGKMTAERKAAIRREERRFGPRKDLSKRSILRTLERAAALVGERQKVLVETDQKLTYPFLLRRAFGRGRVSHSTTNSRLVRDVFNPLFPINHTEAMLRDLLGRIRRRSWLVSKKRRYLDLGLQLWMVYRNFVRRRFNHDDHSAAQVLGWADRRLTPRQLLSWRQDWFGESIHPLSRGGLTVASWKVARAG
jgi:hypothetical protein